MMEKMKSNLGGSERRCFQEGAKASSTYSTLCLSNFCGMKLHNTYFMLGTSTRLSQKSTRFSVNSCLEERDKVPTERRGKYGHAL